MTPFTGLLAYPITPADRSGRVDAEAMEALADRLAESGVDGIGVLGSTGTYMFLRRDERRRAVRAALRGARGRVPVTVGIGALRTDGTIQAATDAAEDGADGLLLAPVSYTPLFQHEVAAHVRAVSTATALPLCLYDNPATTGFRFEPDLLRACGRLPTVVAVKRPAPPEGAPGWLAEQRALFRADVAIGCSVDWHAGAALLAGADAWHAVLAGVLPAPCIALARAAKAGDAESVGVLNARLEPVWALFRELGSIRVVSAMAKLLGIANADPPAPILPPDAGTISRIGTALDALRT
ncbi:dihydrodipicolinate synthase family protein [Acetobacteraceae bacterium KSS8]|uniref:Dihydrodipicolinate synthase family protein n=1 Tax=Endosaccharibacter trunci TaxID=2812733 RepID=A0ABT1WA06_9PROT|nr:dihydrodipicolinate synthase family protein [Acetobacteraceae bacterium KSS8]